MPFTVKGHDLVIVNMALHYMSAFPAAYMDKDRMWGLRDLATAAYDALQREHKQEARIWEKKQHLPKGSVIRAPRNNKRKRKPKSVSVS